MQCFIDEHHTARDNFADAGVAFEAQDHAVALIFEYGAGQDAVAGCLESMPVETYVGCLRQGFENIWHAMEQGHDQIFTCYRKSCIIDLT